jgi:hypothetical protein
MNIDHKTLRLAVSLICISLIPLIDVAAQDSPPSITGTVLIEKEDGTLVEPGLVLKVLFEGPNNNHFTRPTQTTGYFKVEVNDLGLWFLTAKKTNYTQRDPRPVRVQVENNKTVTTDPRNLVLNRNPPPTPSPTPNQGGAQLVLILYRTKPAIASTINSQSECKERNRHGRVVLKRSSSDSLPLTDIELVITVNNSKTGKLEDFDTVKTGSDGTYNFDLPKGEEFDEYILSIGDKRFQPYTLYLDRNECLPGEIILEPVTVESETPGTLIEVDEATRRSVFSPEVMQALPVPRVRNFDAFALLAPGVLPPPEPMTLVGPGVSPGLGLPGQFSINGLRSRENNFTIDGSDNNDEDIGARRQGFVNVTPQSIESLQEFQVVTAVGDARFGRNLGGQINAVTKSGSNHLHGSLYGYFTDNSLNARNFFDQVDGGVSTFALRRASDGTPVLLDGQPLTTSYTAGGEDQLTHTQVGFDVGGPIKPNTAFFFVSATRQIIRASNETHFAVPTVQERGIFGTGETGLLADDPDPPFTTRSLSPASIPGNALFSLYPFPNNPNGPYGANTYSVELPADGDGKQFSGKIDLKFGNSPIQPQRRLWSFLTDGDIFRVRYNFNQDKRVLPTVGEALFSTLRARVRTQNVSLSLNRLLTAKLSDTIRFSFGRTRLSFDEVRNSIQLPSSILPDTTLLLNAPLLLNVTAPNLNGTLNPTTYVSAASPQGTALLNSFGYSSVTQAEQITGPLGQVIIPGFSQLGVDVLNFPQSRANNTIQIGDTITYTRGNMTSIFGVDVRKFQINSTLDRGFRPQAVFNNLRSSAASSLLRLRAPDGSPLPTEMFSGTTLSAIGLPTGLFQTLAVNPNSNIGLRFTQVNFFAQGQWRFTGASQIGDKLYRPTIQFIFGVRYELNSVPDTVGRRLESALDPTELSAEATRVAATCNTQDSGNPQVGRCRDLVGGLGAAFPPDFRFFGSDRDDFNVRLGVVTDLRGDGKLITRAGFGTYSGQVLGVVIGQSRNAFPKFLPVNLSALPPVFNGRTYLFNLANPAVRQLNPSLSLIAPGTINTLSVSPVEFLTARPQTQPGLIFDPTIKGLDVELPQNELLPPYSIQYAFTTEWQFTKRYLLGVSYVGTRGVKLLRLATPDQGQNRIFGATDTLRAGQLNPATTFPFFTGTTQLPQTGVISDSFAIARTLFESSATSNFNSLQFEIRKRFSRVFYFGTAATYSHSIDDASDIYDTAGAFALPQNSLRRSERASSNYDVRWRWVTFFAKETPKDLPFRKGGSLGGWQFSGVITAQTGQPFTVNTTFDINRDGNQTDRLNTTNGLIQGPIEGDRRRVLSLAPGVDPSSLLASDGSDGSVGRNTFRAVGSINFDVSLTKFFIRKEPYKFYFRAEIFNLFNHAHFGIPVRILESPAFGSSVRTIIPARTIRLVVKFSF